MGVPTVPHVDVCAVGLIVAALLGLIENPVAVPALQFVKSTFPVLVNFAVINGAVWSLNVAGKGVGTVKAPDNAGVLCNMVELTEGAVEA